jgi:ParB-like chromosome segregation protein Spo0J
MTTPIHSARSPRTERWLDDLGVAWTFDPDLPLHRIDRAASLANQVRHVALDPDTVERYAADMSQGDQFPPLIVTPAGDLVALLGGNHRHAGAERANRTTLPAYVVTGEAKALLRVRVEDNRNHGLPTTEAERTDHGLALIESGFSQAEAARITGVPAKKLSEARILADVADRATVLGVDPGFHRLSRFCRQALARIDDDAVFTAAASMVATTSMPITSVRPLVDAALAVEPVEALRIIAAETEEYEARGKDLAGNTRATSRSPRALLDNALAIIRGLDPQAVVDACPNDDTRMVLAQRIMDAAAVLAPTHEALTTRVKAAA